MKIDKLSSLHGNNKKNNHKNKTIVNIKTCPIVSMPDLKGLSHKSQNIYLLLFFS